MEGSTDQNSLNQMNKEESPQEYEEMRAEATECNAEGEQLNVSAQEAVMATPEDEVHQSGSKQYPCAPAPPIEIKLFVGRIPRSMSEDDVRPIFAKFGDVIEVAIIRERGTSAHKGSAFIRMACIAEADSAIRELNGHKILDTGLGPILVKYAAGEAEKLGLTSSAGEEGVDQAKLFVGSLPKTVTDEKVKEIFEPFGSVDEIFVMKDSSGAGKGCAFVKFAYKEQALHASKQLDGKKTLEGLTRPMEVRCAESRGQKNDTASGTMAGNKMMRGFGMGMNPVGGGYFPTPFGGNAMGGMPAGSNVPRITGPWKEYFNNEGRPYYHNEMTNVTQWDMPAEFDQLRSGMPSRGTGEAITGPPGANLFVFHIPNEWTDGHLAGAFSQFGPIVSATIAKDKSGIRNRGFGFVSYTNPASASAAVNGMNGFMAFGKRLKVSFKQGEKEVAAQMTSGGSALGTSTPNGTITATGGGINTGCSNAAACGMQPGGMNMMNPYAAMQGGQYGYAGNRYTPY